MADEQNNQSSESAQSSENITLPPISKQTAGAATGAIIGAVAGPVGAVVGGVLGALFVLNAVGALVLAIAVIVLRAYAEDASIHTPQDISVTVR